MSRRQIRRELRRQRRSLTVREQQRAALAVRRRLIRLSTFRNARRIGCYLANDGEVDLQVVIDRIQAMHKRCYLPVLDTLRSNRLWFAPLTADTPLRPNRFGIPEPDVSARHYVAASHLDLLLLPLVAFDPQGNRLGMGGGFYDRSLAFLKHRCHWFRPRLYGVAHEFQCLARLQQASWDIPLHGIITDQHIYTVSRS
jgi:5-formyltetrahydrofolate cyclo-ligase